ncbi:glycosyltransferase family 2 protein [Carboxydochorda subterranea]|uniref:Glycosyltransferase family 2 protein n=1 Tax=Carboxydichorda subterranea TaxID=3109565 RepID=A0ABZ1BVL0_9FIRM|nr:glycosyltransferase family 2 protein [Limnochorda sp. L945t]WRP16638.1 glycosyltransferase family 2 protein [Limnochorda sp. L945t]
MRHTSSARTAGDGPRAPVDVDLVIVSYGRHDLLEACVASFTRHTAGYRYRLIVVDNTGPGPMASHLDRLERQGALVIRNAANAGYARACNQGIAAGNGRYVVLLNNDVRATPGWLPPLVRCMEEDPSVAVAGPLLVTPDGYLVGVPVTGTDLDPHQPGLWQHESVWPLPRRPVACLTVSGAAYMIRRACLAHVGLMDEGFFLYFEDADFSLRARRAGYRVVWCPGSRLVHLVSATGRDHPARDRVYQESARRFWRKWGGLPAR